MKIFDIVNEGAMPPSPTPQGQQRFEKMLAAKKARAKQQFLKKKDRQQGVEEARAATAAFRAGNKKRAQLNAMSDEERKAYDKEQQEKQRKRDDARLERERQKNAAKKGVAEDSDPCWDNYKQIGMKEKNGKKVPNCVPKEGVAEGSEEVDTKGRTRQEWTRQVHAKYPQARVMHSEDGESYAILPNGNKVKWIKDEGVFEQGVAEDWQKVNKSDKTDGMSKKAVKAYRRENPGSKLKTAVTTKPSKLKAGSKDAKRRKSFCARMSGNPGPMKDEKGRPTPKAKALARWNCNE